MGAEKWLWATLAGPAVGAGVSLLLAGPRAVVAVVRLTGTIALLSGGLAAWEIAGGGPVRAAGGWLYADALSAIHLVVVVGVFAGGAALAGPYFAHETAAGRFGAKEARRFGALWCGAEAAMAALLLSNNLGLVWVAVEATTLLTAFLICVHVTPTSIEAMWKYLLMCSVGVAFAFMGTLLVAASAKGLKVEGAQALFWTSLVKAAPHLDAARVKAGFVFLLVGYGTKVGLAPMHSWLPDAHSQAPAPVSAVFSGCMLSTALYCIMRFLPIVGGATGGEEWAADLLRLLGLTSLLLAAVFLLFQRDLKRMLAYSSVEHLGIVALGLGLGAAGAFAALLHTINHSIGKTLSFASAGRLGQIHGSVEMARMPRSWTRAPFWSAGLTIGLLALVGAAPFAVFQSEYRTAAAAAEAGRTWTLVLLLASLSLVFVSVARHLIGVLWSEPKGTPEIEERSVARSGAAEILLIAVPAVLLLALGLWMPTPLQSVLEQASHIVQGAP